MASIVIGMTVILAFILIKSRKLKPGPVEVTLGQNKIKFGGESESIQQDRRESCRRHVEVDESLDNLREQRSVLRQKIMGQQVRLIRGTFEQFSALLPESDPLLVESLWNRLANELYLSAVENHIFDHVHGDRIDTDYVDDKIEPVFHAYRRLTSRYDLPDWKLIETDTRRVLIDSLESFYLIAKTEYNSYKQTVEATIGLIGPGHPAIEKRIEKLVEEL